MNTKSSIEKLQMLEELELMDYLNNDQYQFLRCLSSDEDSEVRSKVAEILVNFKNEQAKKILISLLKDEEELVRVNACDSLCIFSSDEVIYLLKDRILKDRSSLVKGYSIFSLVDIIVRLNDEIDETKNFFNKVLKAQKVKWVKICIYKALYLLGDNEYLDMLIEELDNRYYRNRCIVLNILSELISDTNGAKIYSALNKRSEKETSIAVKSKIEELLISLK